MTGVVAAGALHRLRASARFVLPVAATDIFVAFALVLLFLLGHSFVGIDHDARIYMGRALADLDPTGVGRDLLFVDDGQSSFSVFRSIARTLVASLGLTPAVVVFNIVNLAAWFGAIVAFVRALAPGRAAALVLAVAFVLPLYYTPWHLLAAGESIPVPRPLAEAGVLLAMAALCQGRTLLAVAALLGAALFHPIMAAPGFAVLLLVAGMRDRRWWVGAALIFCLVLGAALLGLPVASRLLVVIDPAWRAILLERTSYLFVTTWPVQAIGMLVVQATTIVLACFHLDGQPRRVMAAAVVTGILGVAASALFCDGLSALLVVQAQMWRALWLPAVLAPVAAGLCVLRLGGKGGGDAIVLALLVLAWATLEVFPMGPLAALAAFGVHLAGRVRPLALGRSTVAIIWIFCLALAVATQAQSLTALVIVLRRMPPGAMMPWHSVWPLGFAMLPVGFIAYACWRWPTSTWTRVAATLAFVGGVALAATQWDSRQPMRADLDSGRHRADLRAMIALRPGEILWLQSGRTEAIWFWLGRGNWNSHTQGAAVVFSRDLALKWQARAQMMRDARLATEPGLSPWKENGAIEPVDVFAADLAGFCRKADAPAWIIAPIEQGQAIPQRPGIRVWTSGFLESALLTNGEGFRWSVVDRYAVMDCAQM